MKTLPVHLLWGVAALALAAASSIVSRRSTEPPPPAPRDGRSEAVLRARIAELEADLAQRPAESRPAAESPRTEAPEKPSASVPAPASPDRIRTLLKSANKDDLAAAVKELEAMTDRPLKLALLREMLHGGSAALESRAVSLLRKMGGPDAVPLLLEVLAKEGPAGPRTQAALALAEIGDASAIPALREAYRSPDLQVRSAAAVGLDRFGQPEPAQATLRTLGGMLDSADGGAREDAVDLLTKIPVPGALPLLVKALEDATNNHLREDAADAMGANRMVDALPYLERALQDPSANVREAAQRAINRIKAPKP